MGIPSIIPGEGLGKDAGARKRDCQFFKNSKFLPASWSWESGERR